MKPLLLILLLTWSYAFAGCAHRDSDSAEPAVIHHSVFDRIVLSPNKPESNGIRLLGIRDGMVRVRLSNGYIIAAPAREGEIFRYASHGYWGFTGIPLYEVNLRTGRVVLEFETRVYTSHGKPTMISGWRHSQ